MKSESCTSISMYSFSALTLFFVIVFCNYIFFIQNYYPKRALHYYEKRLGNLLYTISFACFIGFTFFIFPINPSVIYEKYYNCFTFLNITPSINRNILPYILICLHFTPIAFLYLLGFYIEKIQDVLLFGIAGCILLYFDVFQNIYPFSKWKVFIMIFISIFITYFIHFIIFWRTTDTIFRADYT
jgi:hypothetical protein